MNMRNSKREKGTNIEAEPEASRSKVRPRTTVFLPEPLEFNLDLLALQTGRPKADIIRTALASYLRNECNMDPTQKPQIELKYASGL
jgi:hypothetical protein